LKLVVRHDDSFSKGLRQKGSSFSHPSYCLLSRRCYGAGGGFFNTTLWVIRTPPSEVDARRSSTA
jgi:hypothetical protein